MGFGNYRKGGRKVGHLQIVFLFWERERCIQYFVELCFFWERGGAWIEFGPLKNDELGFISFIFSSKIYTHAWFWDYPLDQFLLLFFTSSFFPPAFPRSPCRKSPGPKPGVTGVTRFSSFCPMKSAWMLQVLAWDHGVGGNHLPPRMGRLRSFFLDDFFQPKKNAKEWWFSLFFEGTLTAADSHFFGPVFLFVWPK